LSFGKKSNTANVLVFDFRNSINTRNDRVFESDTKTSTKTRFLYRQFQPSRHPLPTNTKTTLKFITDFALFLLGGIALFYLSYLIRSNRTIETTTAGVDKATIAEDNRVVSENTPAPTTTDTTRVHVERALPVTTPTTGVISTLPDSSEDPIVQAAHEDGVAWYQAHPKTTLSGTELIEIGKGCALKRHLRGITADAYAWHFYSAIERLTAADSN